MANDKFTGTIKYKGLEEKYDGVTWLPCKAVAIFVRANPSVTLKD